MEKFANEVWIFIEQRSGKPADVSFELLSKGRKLAEALKGSLKSVVIGSEMKDVAQQTFQYGAEECLLVDHPDFCKELIERVLDSQMMVLDRMRALPIPVDGVMFGDDFGV